MLVNASQMMGPEPKSATMSVLSDLSTVSESPFGNQILRKEETYHGSCVALSRLPLTRKMNQGYPNTARLDSLPAIPILSVINTTPEALKHHVPAVQRCSAPHASPPSLSCALVPSDASYSAQRCGSPGDSLPPCILYAAVPGK